MEINAGVTCYQPQFTICQTESVPMALCRGFQSASASCSDEDLRRRRALAEHTLTRITPVLHSLNATL